MTGEPLAPKPVSAATRHVMQANKSKNTKPELKVRAALREAGLSGYRLHWKKAPGKPDICFPGRHVAIFVNGCFWHRCPHCGLSMPKSNVEFWGAKFARNRARDARDNALLVSGGWTVITIWECRLKKGRLPDASAPGACQVVGSCQCVAGGEPARPEEGITTPTYVYSDVHGHRATLERALERVSPSEQDRFFCLGDMIDRGPDPLGVIAVTRALPNVCVLKGNHEDLMLRALRGADQVEMSMCAMDWAMNGGSTTSDALEALDDEDASMVVDWVEQLPCWAQVRVGERDYILTHAGIDPWRVEVPAAWDEGSIERLMAAQRPDDLLWIRHGYWDAPTGLLSAEGKGPVPTRNADGLAQMVKVGASGATGGVADRWDIDAGAAGGAGFGQVLVLRLDDGACFYEPILPGE